MGAPDWHSTQRAARDYLRERLYSIALSSRSKNNLRIIPNARVMARIYLTITLLRPDSLAV